VAPTYAAVGPTVAAGAQGAVSQAQTAAAVAPTMAAGAQTAVVGAQTAVSTAQTALPGAQATAQAAATLVAGAQVVARQLQLLLNGANVQVTLEPPNAPNDQVQVVSITGTDTSGNLSKLDEPSREAAAQGALLVMAQLYPSATINVSITASDGTPLLSASRPPS
jgi:putative membrane protein